MSGRPWTEEDDDYLALHWWRFPSKFCAEKLNRTVRACSLRASYLRRENQRVEQAKRVRAGLPPVVFFADPDSTERRQKVIARAIANVNQKRGRLTPQPCARCQTGGAEKHHPDYSKPLDVVWLCRACHLVEHPQKGQQHTEAA